MPSSTVKSNQNKLKPWTCIFIGSTIASANNNFASTGNLGRLTMLTIGPNITPPNIIEKPDTIFSLPWLFLKRYALTNNKPHVWPHQRLSFSPSHFSTILKGCDDAAPMVSTFYLHTTALLPDVFPRTTKTCNQQTYIVMKLDNRFDNDYHVD